MPILTDRRAFIRVFRDKLVLVFTSFPSCPIVFIDHGCLCWLGFHSFHVFIGRPTLTLINEWRPILREATLFKRDDLRLFLAELL